MLISIGNQPQCDLGIIALPTGLVFAQAERVLIKPVGSAVIPKSHEKACDCLIMTMLLTAIC